MEKLPVYKTEGIILKSADLGQLDRLLAIYTLGYGKILARAISVRKKEAKLKGLLEPFTHARFLLAKSRTIDIVTDVEPIDNFSFLHKNLESLAYAYYFSELIDKLVVAPERDEKIWALVLRAFEVLDDYARYCHSERSEESPALVRQSLGDGGNAGRHKVGDSSAYGLRMTKREERINLPKIRTLFELKLLEFLGHGLPKNKKALEVIQGLAGGIIKSSEFFKKVTL